MVAWGGLLSVGFGLGQPKPYREGAFSFLCDSIREPGWVSLHDPTTGEWHDFPARDCFPSIVEEANGKRRKGGAA
jgi:hypothetical protein